jgi:hypothetical protein
LLPLRGLSCAPACRQLPNDVCRWQQNPMRKIIATPGRRPEPANGQSETVASALTHVASDFFTWISFELSPAQTLQASSVHYANSGVASPALKTTGFHRRVSPQSSEKSAPIPIPPISFRRCACTWTGSAGEECRFGPTWTSAASLPPSSHARPVASSHGRQPLACCDTSWCPIRRPYVTVDEVLQVRAATREKAFRLRRAESLPV